MSKSRLPLLVAFGLSCVALAACDSKDSDEPDVLILNGDEDAMGDPGEDPADSDGEDPTDSDGEDPTDSDGEEDAPVECEQYLAQQSCEDAGFSEGVQYCDTLGEGGALEWGPCVTNPQCTPGDTYSCGFCDGLSEQECEENGFGGEWYYDCELYDGVPTMAEEACNTPLVLSFDGGAVQMTDARAATFDINAPGECITTDWPTAATPWLALDLDRSGSIESGRELFGSGTRLADGQRARNGFLALSELDTNGDGKITMSDERFSELVLWSDHDGDRQATFSELEGLGPRGILSIELSYHVDPRCDARGNCEMERAAFSFIDRAGAVRSGEIVDIHLTCQ